VHDGHDQDGAANAEQRAKRAGAHAGTYHEDDGGQHDAIVS
jgi:hypothetical protein